MSDMRVGLIARANDRGLGIQTWEAWRHYDFARTAVVLIPDRQFADRPARYECGKGGDPAVWHLDTRAHQLVEGKVKRWAEGLDVVFSVETLYDWRVADWVREVGGRTVVQANPEFWVHRRKPNEVQPDVWAWPTPWRPFDDMPEGVSLPVPVPDNRPDISGSEDGPFVVLHVAGHRALDDRNGSDGFVEALRRIREKVTVRIIGQDGQLPKLGRMPDNVTVEQIPDGVGDRWEMYRGVHLVVLPRRYGGLCLPALEAAASGCALAMTNTPPNGQWPIIPIDCRQGRNLNTQAGLIRTVNAVPDSVAYTINTLARNRERATAHQAHAWHWAQRNTWSRLRMDYDKVFRGAIT